MELVVKDCNGVVLKDGDTVHLTKSLKVKGSASVLKQGASVKNIKLTNSADEIEGKVNNQMMVLKTSFVKKS